MSKKSAELSSGLVAVKGTAVPPSDMPTRTAPFLAAVPAPPVSVVAAPVVAPPPPPQSEPTREEGAGQGGNLAPLNFRVSAAFRREFKTYAATHDLKLNELLRLSFESYRRQNGS
jgi:hypothetical protein